MLKTMATLKRGILAVEVLVMRAARALGRVVLALFDHIDRGSRRAEPAVSRFICLVAPALSRAWERVRAIALAGFSWFRPRFLRFWTWIGPLRKAIWRGLLWVANKFGQCGGLTAKEAIVMRDAIGSDDQDALWRTRTRVDVGMWYRKGRIWACPLADELLLFAEGARPWAERMAYSEISESRYNHVTAEIALAPSESLPVSTLRVAPVEALALMKHFRRVANGA